VTGVVAVVGCAEVSEAVVTLAAVPEAAPAQVGVVAVVVDAADRSRSRAAGSGRSDNIGGQRSVERRTSQ